MLAIQQHIADIMTLAIMTHIHTEQCVFVSFSGHVQLLTVSIRKNTVEYETEIAKRELYIKPCTLTTKTEYDAFERQLLVELTHVKQSLEAFIKDGAVDRLRKDMMPVSGIPKTKTR